MPLKLTYIGQTSVPVEIEGVTPDAVRGKDVAEIERLPIYHGNQQVPLAEFFRVEGTADDGRLEFLGNLSGVHWIGAHMKEGTIVIDGAAGRHVGSEMSGGEIHVLGDAGDWVGGEMRGGLIYVRGRAGHLVGSAYRGSPRGMNRGTILIAGDAGNEVGHTMRRGLIAVGGAVGDFPVVNMIAGTLLAFGGCGIRPAAGMRRGTLGLLGGERAALLPTFRYGGRCRLGFLDVLLRALKRLGFGVASEFLGREWELWHGDLLTVGRGEIVVPS
jgi:formylmethanofuran dehydrogenase subunit C